MIGCEVNIPTRGYRQEWRHFRESKLLMNLICICIAKMVISFIFHIFCFRDFSSQGGKNGFQASEKAAWHPEREFQLDTMKIENTKLPVVKVKPTFSSMRDNFGTK